MIQIPHEKNLADLALEQSKDPIVKKVRYYWSRGQKPSQEEQREVKEFFRNRGSTIIEDNGVLYIQSEFGGQKVTQLVTPSSLVHRILQKGHDEGGHLGADKTLDVIRRKYYWPTLFRDVKDWCRTCKPCQQRKNPVANPKAPLQYPPVASHPGQMIAMDFVGPLPLTAEKNRYLLVITDMFSKYAEAVPCPNQEAETTADALVRHYICKHGLPDILHSDQGRNFESQVIHHLCLLLNIRRTRTSPYHPSANGQCERYNKTLIEMISLYIKDDQTDWDKWVPLMLFSYHSTPHASTRYTPFQLQIGRQPRTPFDTIAETLIETEKKPAHSYLTNLQRNMSDIHKTAQKNLIDSMEKRKMYADRKLNYTTYSKGDLVLLREFACKPGLKPKLMKYRWTGPWTIDAVRGPVNYRVTRKLRGKKKRVLVHHDRLKKYRERPIHLQDEEEHANHPQENLDEPEQSKETKNDGLDSDDDSDSDEEEVESNANSDHESEGVEENLEDEQEEQADQSEQSDDSLSVEDEPQTTRSGRVIKTPARYDSYILK